MSRDALWAMVATGTLCAVADDTRAEAIRPGPGSAVADLHRAAATVGHDAALGSDDDEPLLGFATRTLSFGDVLSHSNNTLVLGGPGGGPDTLGSLFYPGDHGLGVAMGTPLSAAPPTAGTIPAPGALWLLALGTLCTRRRRI